MAINLDNLAAEISSQLEDFRDNTVEVMDSAVKRVARETVKDIQKNIDGAGIGGTEYRKSWAQKQDPNMRGKWASGRVVYSKMPQLPHLLEHGHAKVNGGRVEGRPHIAPAEEAAVKKLERYIKAGIEGGE